MKKNITLIIIGILIGGLIFGSVGVVFALTYKASDIVYSPSDTSWNVSTVGEAINSLALSKTSDNYSTEEQVVGTWIDGKPLYQRTLYLASHTSVKNQVNETVLATIPNVSLKSASGYVSIYNDIAIIPYSAVGNTNGETPEHCRILQRGNDIIFNTVRYYNATTNFTDIYVTIKYTKTTDTATN